MPDFFDAEPTTKIKPARGNELSVLAMVILPILFMAWFIAFLGYLVVSPSDLSDRLCPASLAVGEMASGTWLAVGLIPLCVAPALLVKAWGDRVPTTGLPPPDHRRRRVVAGIHELARLTRLDFPA